MTRPEKVAILGLGAMGAYFASRFLLTPHVCTSVLAKGQRYARLMENGVQVNGQHFKIPLVHPEEKPDPATLIIVALKHHQLAEAAHDLQNLVGDQTTIISVMNGLDSENFLGSIYGMDKVLYTISVGIDAVREGSEVSYTNPGKQIFGAADNQQLSPRVKTVQDLFRLAGIPFETPPDMIRMLWWKFMINVGMNQASAVLRAPYSVFQQSREAQQLMIALMREVIALADVTGIKLGEDAIEDWYPVLHALAPQGKTSMLQDIEAGRKTEVEIFAGKVVELAEAYDIPAPVNRTFLQTIRVLEAYPTKKIPVSQEAQHGGNTWREKPG
ncbi:ketopantoate reductase family protein [Geopsychrobacter electrodiphilus]|uniref:ketopantoate reductase family protein n=1 Tax=Geopsychrobacter electrodiphilus TaxID=225196 RepID=UPI00037484AD|nr:ketopantoate reductase family protein [Geopsychrobacter electrodiphilus]